MVVGFEMDTLLPPPGDGGRSAAGGNDGGLRVDPYWQLRPAAPTSDDEVCRCPAGTEVMLRDGLSDNPLFCVACNGEVPPERLGFDARFAEEIANWLSVYDSLYRLWLDSGEYENWAATRLSDPQSQVNRTGREIVARLNELGARTTGGS